MKIYIEITHRDALDVHGFIAIFGDTVDTIIPITMPHQSYEQAIDNKVLIPYDRYESHEGDSLAQSTLFLSPLEIAKQ